MGKAGEGIETYASSRFTRSAMGQTLRRCLGIYACETPNRTGSEGKNLRLISDKLMAITAQFGVSHAIRPSPTVLASAQTEPTTPEDELVRLEARLAELEQERARVLARIAEVRNRNHQ
jgi:hypothetical protein